MDFGYSVSVSRSVALPVFVGVLNVNDCVLYGCCCYFLCFILVPFYGRRSVYCQTKESRHFIIAFCVKHQPKAEQHNQPINNNRQRKPKIKTNIVGKKITTKNLLQNINGFFYSAEIKLSPFVYRNDTITGT